MSKKDIVIKLNPANKSFEGQAHHKIPLTLIVNATDTYKGFVGRNFWAVTVN